MILSLPDSGKTHGLDNFSTSFAATIFNQAVDSLNAKLDQSSRLFSKSRKCSLWERYWIAATMGAISALPAGRWPLQRQAGLLTNLLLIVL